MLVRESIFKPIDNPREAIEKADILWPIKNALTQLIDEGHNISSFKSDADKYLVSFIVDNKKRFFLQGNVSNKWHVEAWTLTQPSDSTGSKTTTGRSDGISKAIISLL